MDLCVSKLRFAGDEAAVADLVEACVRTGADGRTAIALTAAAPAPAPGEHPAGEWLLGAWGTEELDIAGVLTGRSAGFAEFEVCTPLGPPSAWCAVIAEHTGLRVEVLWNDELGHAGRVTFDGAHRMAAPMRSDALTLHGWLEPPWVFEPEPAEVMSGRLLATFTADVAASMLRGHGLDDAYDTAVAAATTLATLLDVDREFVERTLDALEHLDAVFTFEVRRFLAPLAAVVEECDSRYQADG